MNANLLTLKNVTKGFSDLIYQVYEPWKNLLHIHVLVFSVLDPEQSCVFLKLKKNLLQLFLGYEVRFEAVWFGPPLYSGSFLLMFCIWLNFTLDKV